MRIRTCRSTSWLRNCSRSAASATTRWSKCCSCSRTRRARPTPMPGLEMVPYPLRVQSKFDMAVFVTETEQGVSVIWLYNPDLFDATTIERMAGLFQLVLEKATSDPTLRLSQLLEVLAEEDQQHRAARHKEFQEARHAETEERQTQDSSSRIVAGDQGPMSNTVAGFRLSTQQERL